MNMKRFKILLIAVLTVLLTCSYSTAAESMYEDLQCNGDYCTLRLSWTTAAGGTFTAVETATTVDGWIIGIQTDPGEASPTDNYDINLQSKFGSVINGQWVFTYRNIDGDTGTWSGGECTTAGDGVLANRDTTVTEYTQFLNNGNYGGQPNRGKLRVDISNAGNSKAGVIEIYYIRMK